MKTSFLVFLVAFLVLAVPVVFAADALSVSDVVVEVNGIEVPADVALEAGEVIPMDIYFTVGENASDVEVSAWLQGHRSEGVEKDFKDLIDGRRYHVRLSLEVTKDIDEIDEDATLYVRIETDAGNWEESYILTAQREPFNANILFVETDNLVEAGSKAAVDIVVKNLGRHELDDLIVQASIPELGISKRAYFGDLQPTDDEDLFGEDAEDAVERRLYLNIPVNTPSGSYSLIVEASNDDVEASVNKDILISGAEVATRVLVPVSSKELNTGETVSYSLVIVNSGNRIGVYEIVPETAEGIVVSVDEPIVTVPAGSSRVVELQVKAGDREGTYSFVVNVNSEGKIVDTAIMSASVVKGTALGRETGSLTILTIILAIVFVVLLVVLVVLLTRKPQKAEEFEESYY